MFAISVFIVGSAAVLVRHLDVHAGGVPRRAGHRRRRPVHAGARDHRRHRLARASGPATPATSWPSSARRACSARSIGGFFAGQAVILGLTGWRWVFLVNVPIGIAALFVVYRTLHLHHHRRDARIDWWGAVALMVGLVPLLTVAEQGREWGWGSPRCDGSATSSAPPASAAFIYVEARMGDDALIPLRMFRQPVGDRRDRGQRHRRRRHVRRHHGAPALHADRARRLAR